MLEKREQVWISAWTAVANANDCKEASTAAKWADKCLTAFDERFPQPPQQTPQKQS